MDIRGDNDVTTLIDKVESDLHKIAKSLADIMIKDAFRMMRDCGVEIGEGEIAVGLTFGKDSGKGFKVTLTIGPEDEEDSDETDEGEEE